jgi:hypothetical protein
MMISVVVDDDKAGGLERLRENARMHFGMYSTTACLTNCINSNFPHLAIINCICLSMYKGIQINAGQVFTAYTL